MSPKRFGTLRPVVLPVEFLLLPTPYHPISRLFLTLRMAPKEGRFSSVKTDPRFRKTKASKHKVQLDDRFKSVLDEGGVFAADNKRGPSLPL